MVSVMFAPSMKLSVRLAPTSAPLFLLTDTLAVASSKSPPAKGSAPPETCLDLWADTSVPLPAMSMSFTSSAPPGSCVEACEATPAPEAIVMSTSPSTASSVTVRVTLAPSMKLSLALVPTSAPLFLRTVMFPADPAIVISVSLSDASSVTVIVMFAPSMKLSLSRP